MDHDTRTILNAIRQSEDRIIARIATLETKQMSKFTDLQSAADLETADIQLLITQNNTLRDLATRQSTQIAALLAAQENGDQPTIDALTAELATSDANIKAAIAQGDGSTPAAPPVTTPPDTTGGADTTPPADTDTGADTSSGADTIGGADTLPGNTDTVSGS